jgi:hypothetical protein
MNVGAKAATGNILYFYIVIVYPSAFWPHYRWYCSKRESSGCFRMKFDYRHPVLMISQWFTRFNHISRRGGDQSLFITNELFKELKIWWEFRHEDNEIISRLYAKTVCRNSWLHNYFGQKIPPEWDLASTIPFQYHSSKTKIRPFHWKHATVL